MELSDSIKLKLKLIIATDRLADHQVDEETEKDGALRDFRHALQSGVWQILIHEEQLSVWGRKGQSYRILSSYITAIVGIQIPEVFSIWCEVRIWSYRFAIN